MHIFWSLSIVRRFFWVGILIAITSLYLYRLDGVGLLGPDEPRYAAIGRSMAATHEFITPMLWGTPWFEKPPLLYWMAATGTLVGLNPDLAVRLPVALLSLVFLCLSFYLLRREFDSEAAAIGTTLLATSAAWIGYSELCLTDLPLAVFFSLAVFLALGLVRPEPEALFRRARLLLIGVCLGFATLAKGLVPIALALPVLWFLRRFWRDWWLMASSFLVVALPWYLVVYAENGNRFVDEFFWKHHVERVYSASLQHVQPWYYYGPVLIAALFPWTPLLGLLAFPGAFCDQRRRLLACTSLFGLLVFSAVLNKLPGYLLPLMPSTFALIGAQFNNRPLQQLNRAWLFGCALLVSTIPMLSRAMPEWLAMGRFQWTPIKNVTIIEMFYAAVCVLAVFLLRRSWAVASLVLCVCAGGLYLKQVADPVLDTQVSARGVFRELKALPGTVCDAGLNRDWQFGLASYRGSPLPSCPSGTFDFALEPRVHERPLITPLHTAVSKENE